MRNEYEKLTSNETDIANTFKYIFQGLLNKLVDDYRIDAVYLIKSSLENVVTAMEIFIITIKFLGME